MAMRHCWGESVRVLEFTGTSFEDVFKQFTAELTKQGDTFVHAVTCEYGEDGPGGEDEPYAIYTYIS